MSFDQLKRRDFLTLLSAAIAWPAAAHAQQGVKIPRIGYLGFGPASTESPRVEALRVGLRDLGWVDGKSIAIEFRWAETVEQLPELAAELVRIPVDIIFAPSSTMVEPARQATRTIPIVFANHADPVGIGHVASLARPGGNITGLSMLLTELAVKELEMLTEALPQAMRIAVMWNPTTPSHVPAVRAVEDAGDKLGVKLLLLPTRTGEDYEGAFETMARERASGFLDIGSPLSRSNQVRLVELALKHRMPGMFAARDWVQIGGLMSYGADVGDLFRRAAAYIDKILKGAKPADLPVEQASRYQLVINLKTAKALGLELPPILLARADEIIE
jgi:putative tryptophan/tyrosine transport system substrate-binding protein